jgi:hypothetical protein
MMEMIRIFSSLPNAQAVQLPAETGLPINPLATDMAYDFAEMLDAASVADDAAADDLGTSKPEEVGLEDQPPAVHGCAVLIAVPIVKFSLPLQPHIPSMTVSHQQTEQSRSQILHALPKLSTVLKSEAHQNLSKVASAQEKDSSPLLLALSPPAKSLTIDAPMVPVAQLSTQALPLAQPNVTIDHLAAQIMANHFSDQALVGKAAMAPIRFQLSPQFLGNVQVDIVPSQYDLSGTERSAPDIRIITQTQAAQSLLMDHRQMLSAAFGQSGIDIGQVDVQQESKETAAHTAAGFGNHTSPQHGGQGRGAPYTQAQAQHRLQHIALKSSIQTSDPPAVRKTVTARTALRFA